MAFINERISQEDRVKFGLDEIENSKPRGVLIPEDFWIIDKENDIYLRKMRSYNGNDLDTYTGKNLFYFYWENKIYELICYPLKSEKIDNDNRKLKSVWLLNDILNFNDFRSVNCKEDFLKNLAMAFNVPPLFLKNKLDLFVGILELSESLVEKLGK